MSNDATARHIESLSATATPGDLADGICAYIVGGFGNQLFILAAAWAQAERLGCPLYVDTSYYGHPGASWAPLITDVKHPGIDITQVSPWSGVCLIEQPRGLYGAVNAGELTLKLFTDSGFGYDQRIDGIERGTTIVGYFQSPRYFEGIGSQVRDLLISADLAPHEQEYVQAMADDPRVSMHVRRGDYTSPQALGYHGLAEAAYFERAVGLYERLHPDSRYRVYTDSREAVESELSGLRRAELAPPDGSLRSIAGILAMAASAGIIISNSSFSWWAGWLISQANTNATVIAPRPWFRGGDSASDLLLPHWITLDARN